MTKSPKEILFPEAAVGGFTHVDGTIEFYNRVNALSSPDMTILDFGAGRGAAAEDSSDYRRSLQTMKGKVREVIGVDVDEAVLGNPLLDRAIVIRPGERIPLDDTSVDMIIADFVFEHIEDPQAVVAEFARLLKPGGWLCARTPNRWGYVALAARLLPERAHGGVLRRAQPERQTKDVFPTVYEMNSARDLRRHFRDEHWNLVLYRHSAEPAYAGNSLAAWRVMHWLHAALPASLMTTLLVFAQKRPPADG